MPLGPNIERRDLLGGPEPGPGSGTGGMRPVLVLSHDLFNRKCQTVIAMAITSQPQKAGFRDGGSPPEILPKASWVKISQIRTISVDRLGKKIAALDPETMSQLIDGLLELIG